MVNQQNLSIDMPTGIYKRKTMSEEQKKKLSEYRLKNPSQSCFKQGHKGYWLGKKRTAEYRKKISETQKELVKKGIHHLWKGGITEKNKVIRTGTKYKEWRLKIMKRDNYCCQVCNIKSGNGKAVYLEVHHIKTFSQFPELRFELSNGVTLCKRCHSETKKKEEWWENEFRYLQWQNEILFDIALGR